ncbi:hypothetical protein NGRA_1149 [Nosema granulosis]|uniref:Uncharacterized protein n=1 Tax=Nosema granulosis TaxID=83296 RepID=A0A9P6KZN1_9MICR|nr:hypothetical protein NGRA_1149 [Nosema granulosis]
MKYLDDVVMKCDTMETQLEKLDFENVFHLMWVYKNIPYILKHSEQKMEEIVQDLEKIVISDFYPAGIILQYLNQLIYRIYNIKDNDEELVFLKDRCGYNNEEQEEELSGLKKHILSLCKPIVGLHTKEVVDIMAYSYEVDGNEDFDNLFKIFKGSNDILIELHLHKVRINRKRNNKKHPKHEHQKIEETKLELDFKSDDLGITEDMERLNIKTDESKKEGGSIGDSKPFQCSEKDHLKQAKDLLLSFDNPSLKFYIENLALYLSLEYDEEIFVKFINFTTGGYKSICANKIFRLTEVPEEKLCCLISSMENVEKDILRAENLLINSHTFKMFVDWCISSSKGISIALVSDYVDISKCFILFLRKYRHISMFKIFKMLWDCNVVKIDEQIKLNLITVISEIFDIFLDENSTKKSTEESLDRIDSFFKDPVDIKATLKEVVSEMSSTHIYRKSFVHHLAILRHFDQEVKDAAIERMLGDTGLDWRYRTNLLESCFKNHKMLGIDCYKFLDVFTKDKVFYVRMKAKEIKDRLETK